MIISQLLVILLMKIGSSKRNLGFICCEIHKIDSYITQTITYGLESYGTCNK